MKNKLPLLVLFFVLAAPFAISSIILMFDIEFGDTARGDWLSKPIYVEASDNHQWKLLWRNSDCASNCAEYKVILDNLKIALGKHQEKLILEETQLKELSNYKNGLFVANSSGLVLLSYKPNKAGAYNLFKDLKTLIKHGGA